MPGQIRWLTVGASDGADGVELVLEPNSMPSALASQKALYDAGFPATIFTSEDIESEYARLKDRGVVFRGDPKNMGPDTFAFFDDTCGNLVVLNQRNGN